MNYDHDTLVADEINSYINLLSSLLPILDIVQCAT